MIYCLSSLQMQKGNSHYEAQKSFELPLTCILCVLTYYWHSFRIYSWCIIWEVSLLSNMCPKIVIISGIQARGHLTCSALIYVIFCEANNHNKMITLSVCMLYLLVTNCHTSANWIVSMRGTKYTFVFFVKRLLVEFESKEIYRKCKCSVQNMLDKKVKTGTKSTSLHVIMSVSLVHNYRFVIFDVFVNFALHPAYMLSSVFTSIYLR